MPRPRAAITEIPNINIGQEYDQRYRHADIHHERLEALADFFGRNMPVHFHDRFFQLHLVLTGTVHVTLDDKVYTEQAPMFFFTPPTVPHSFCLDACAQGHVLTIRQERVWALLAAADNAPATERAVIDRPLCITLQQPSSASSNRLLQLAELLASESSGAQPAQAAAQNALLQLMLIDIHRLAAHQPPNQKSRSEDVRIFNRFNQLIEQHFTEHRTLPFYCQAIGVTQARLNEVCRRLSGNASKCLIADRLIQEARRCLRFSGASITEISYLLGFKDPAYFARFFRRHVGTSAREFREQQP